MPCEHYKDALIDVAASGGAPQGELRAHLEECASCRAAFDEEQSLFAAIDSGLHAAASAEVPPSLLPHVRAQLDEVVVPRFRWLQPLVFASAGVALVFVVFLMARTRHATPEEVAKQGSVVVPVPKSPVAKTNPKEISTEGTRIATVSGVHSHVARNATDVHSVASGNLEVLVPPDERESLARFVAMLNKGSNIGAALLEKEREKKDAPLSVNRLEITPMEIKPLEGAETEASDGAGEQH